MPSPTTKLGLLSTAAAVVWLVLPGTANADELRHQNHCSDDIAAAQDSLVTEHDVDVDVDSLAFIRAEI